MGNKNEVAPDDFDRAQDSAIKARNALSDAFSLFGQALKKKANAALDSAVSKVKSAHEGAVAGVVAAAETTRDVKNAAVDRTVRVAKGTAAVAEFAGRAAIDGAKGAHASAVDFTSDHVVAPTMDKAQALARSANRKYESVVDATSRGIGHTVDAKNVIVSKVKSAHEGAVAGVVAAAETTRDAKNAAVDVVSGIGGVIADVYDRGANPEQYANVRKNQPKKQVASATNAKPVQTHNT